MAPLISIMNEKYKELTRIMKRYGYSVIVTNRDYRLPFKTVESSEIKIMSPYKFLSYTSSLHDESKRPVVVVDEFHKISDDPLFEAAITLAKVRGYRIVALSATVSDDDIMKVSKWLNAIVVREYERPVELVHQPVPFIYAGYIASAKTLSVNGKEIIRQGEKFRDRYEATSVIASRLYTITSKPVIVWAPTRRLVDRIARVIAERLPERLDYLHIASKIPASNPSERLLKFTVRHGVFIHHGGLSYSVRNIVEDEYKKRGGVIVTAYTLSHGVNLPGTFLILSTIYDYKGDVIDPSTFHQISGRAGRPGYDKKGIVLTIVVGKSEYEVYKRFKDNIASKIKPSLLSDIYSTVKMVLPVYGVNRGNPNVWNIILNLLKQSYHYTTGEVGKSDIDWIMRYVKDVVNYYEKRWDKGTEVAVLTGLHPIEYKTIQDILKSNTYTEAVEIAITNLSQVTGIEKVDVYDDIIKYGFLSVWFGNPQSRVMADAIQTLLESGSFWAGRTYGWKSQEREKLVRIAKKFAYAGNERVEPLASVVRIDVLRRMIKAVPQIVEGTTFEDEAKSLVPIAVKEAFIFSKRVYKSRIGTLINKVYYALTGRYPSQDEFSSMLRDTIRSITENNRGVEII